MEKKVDFYKIRDFSEVFSDSVTFLKENFRNIGKSLVMIVAPVYVIASVLFSFFSMKIVQSFMAMGSLNDNDAAANGILDAYLNPATWVAILLFFIAYLLAVGVIYSYIKLYSERNDNNITPNEVWQTLGGRLLKFFFYSLGYGVFFMIGYVIIVAIAVSMQAIGIIILIPIIIGLVLVLIPFISILVPVIFYEDYDFFGTIGRAVSLLKGNFGKTLGINIVAYLIVQLSVSIIYIIILVPSIIIGVSQQSVNPLLIKILIIVYFVFVPVVLFFAYVFQYSVSSLNYFSLVEARDHVGLRKRVDSIGADNDKPEEQY